MYSLKLIEGLIALSWMALGVIISIFVLLLSNNMAPIEDPKLGGLHGTEKTEEAVDQKSKANPLLAEGKKLFKNNCATCHNKNMTDDMTGPALAGVTARWADYPKEDLYKWIRNSQKLVGEKHPKAVKIFKEWEFSPMTAFPNLENEEIEAILAYIEQ